MTRIFIFYPLWPKYPPSFFIFFTLKVSRFRVPSRLLLLSVLSCHVQQLVVGAISADRAAGVHGSRADSPPPVAHSPTPIYVPVFCSSLWVDCFVIACVLCENRFFIWSFVPLCCRTHSTEIQELVWSADSTGQFWNLRFPKQLLNIACYFVFCDENLMFSFLSSLSPAPWQNLLTTLWIQQRKWSCAKPSCSRAFFWVDSRKNSRLLIAPICRFRSNLTSWCNGWTSYRSALLQLGLQLPLLAWKEQFIITRNCGLIRLLLTRVNPTWKHDNHHVWFM